MTEQVPTFDDALDWIASRVGRPVCIEIGIPDPTQDQAVFAPMMFHAVLGAIGMADDTDFWRGIAYVPLKGAGDRNRIYLDAARVSSVRISGFWLVVEFHSSLQVRMVSR